MRGRDAPQIRGAERLFGSLLFTGRVAIWEENLIRLTAIQGHGNSPATGSDILLLLHALVVYARGGDIA
jgi:hypothetical protein